MQLNRIRVSEKADNYLRHLKGVTGLTPNLLCRIGFCLSLRQPKIPNIEAYDEGGFREFNRFTLLGQWDSLFIALLKERCLSDGLDIDEVLEDQFMAHLNRGIILLFQRVKGLEDLSRLIDEVYQQEKA